MVPMMQFDGGDRFGSRKHCVPEQDPQNDRGGRSVSIWHFTGRQESRRGFGISSGTTRHRPEG